MTETAETRLKRLRMRSWRRGIKEMDLILGGWADRRLSTLSTDDLEVYDALLEENDRDLYAWVTGASDVPPRFAALMADIAEEVRRG
jgi:antitoxin CptB